MPVLKLQFEINGSYTSRTPMHPKIKIVNRY